MASVLEEFVRCLVHKIVGHAKEELLGAEGVGLGKVKATVMTGLGKLKAHDHLAHGIGSGSGSGFGFGSGLVLGPA